MREYISFNERELSEIYHREDIDYTELMTVGYGLRVIDLGVAKAFVKDFNNPNTDRDGHTLLRVLKDANNLCADTVVLADSKSAFSNMELIYDVNNFNEDLMYLGFNVERPTSLKNIILKEISELEKTDKLTVEDVFAQLNCYYLLVQNV